MLNVKELLKNKLLSEYSIKCQICGSKDFELIRFFPRQTASERFLDYTIKCKKCGHLLLFSKQIDLQTFEKILRNKNLILGKVLIPETKEDKLQKETKSQKKNS